MRITLLRVELAATYTIGELSIDGAPECFTLEDCVRPPGVKIYGQTAIPAGSYRVIRSYSNRFGKVLPEVLEVPGFAGIRIHAGNTSKDTEGCILVGRTRAPGAVLESRVAMRRLDGRIKAALDAGERVTLEIANPA